MTTEWIASNAIDGAMWHAARRREWRTAVTKRVVSVAHVPLCTGRVLGGAYGYSRVPSRADVHGATCRRCEAIVARSGAGEATT